MLYSRFSLVALLTCYMLPCLAGPIHLSDSGMGSAVIVPFWTVNGEQDSLLTINNDGPRPSAVRVRILDDEGELLSSLGVYLDRDDQWTAAFVAAGDQASLISEDASCVLLEDGTSFLGDSGSEVASLPATAGSIEIIEMATATLDSQASLSGMWPDCEELAERFTNGIWSDNPNTILMAPADGISASISIVRVGAGTLSTLHATALSGFSDIPLHAPPSKQEPDLSNATDVDSENLTVRSRVCFDEGCRIDHWQSPLEAVAAVLSVASLRIDFNANDDILGKFDLVLHRPLERYENGFDLLIDRPVSLFLTDQSGASMLPEEGGLRLDDNQVMQIIGFEFSSLFLDPPAPQPSPVLAFPALPEFSLGALGENASNAGTAEIRFETAIDPGIGLIAGDGFRVAGEPVIAFGIQQYSNGVLDAGLQQPVLSSYRGTVIPRTRRRLDPPLL